MHFLVTGGAGFVGSHLVDRLIAAGHRVTVVDDLSSGDEANLHAEAEFHCADILQDGLVMDLAKDCDGIFHLAAIASPMRALEEWRHAHAVNLTATIGCFEAAVAHNIPIVYASSAAVYGEVASLPITEEAPTHPINSYGVDKLGCDWHARIGRELKQLKAIGVRPFNIYGPRQKPDSAYSGVISIFADRLSKGEPLVIFGDGEQTRDFVYVADAVACFDQAMQGLMKDAMAIPAVMNLCSGLGTSLLQLASTMQSVWSTEVELLHEAARAGDIRLSLGDPSCMRAALKLPTFTPIAQGLEDLRDWMQGLKN
jgi:UDP-glucose 4-epimerase